MHELDGYTSRHFKLKRFAVLDRSTGRDEVIYAPEDWRARLNIRDRICIVHPRGDYRVQIGFDVFRRLLDTTSQREHVVGQIVEGMQAARPTRPITTEREGDCALIETVMHADEGYQLFRLVRLWPRDDVFFAGQANLIFRSELADLPETLDLIELFRSQLMRAKPIDDLPIASCLPPPKPDARFNFRKLKVVRPHGFMELRVPTYWEAEEDEEGRAAYFDPDEEALTLFVNYVLILRFPDNGGELHRKVEMSASEEVEGDGFKLRRIKWMVSDSTHERAMWAIVDLVMDADRADTPEFRELVGIMNDEVRRMRIGMPPASAEACAQPRREVVAR